VLFSMGQNGGSLERDHSPSSVVEVKNVLQLIFSLLYVLMAWCCVKNRCLDLHIGLG
jgi:hypothetical protein